MPEIVATIMLEATSSTSLPLSFFLLATKMVAIHTSSVREPDVASFAASLSCKRHKLIMSRKKRHSLRQLSLSLFPFVSLSPAFDLNRRCFAFALLARGSYNCLVWSGLLRCVGVSGPHSLNPLSRRHH